jgi:hypothetical protein
MGLTALRYVSSEASEVGFSPPNYWSGNMHVTASEVFFSPLKEGSGNMHVGVRVHVYYLAEPEERVRVCMIRTVRACVCRPWIRIYTAVCVVVVH